MHRPHGHPRLGYPAAAMNTRHWRLINEPDLEALPAALARARGNRTARALAAAEWLIRRKHDGRYLAAARRLGRSWCVESLAHGGSRADLAVLAERLTSRDRTGATLPLDRLPPLLAELGIPEDYGTRHGLALVPEPRELAFAGFDRYRRPLWLAAGAARAWERMRQAARNGDVWLEAISGYRSHHYQLGIFRRKLARGRSVTEILAVNAAPGYSEHHGGHALDIGTPGEPPAEESFERTAAFAWLSARAGEFGFTLSYPRDNPHGIVYEPWHWCWRPLA